MNDLEYEINVCDRIMYPLYKEWRKLTLLKTTPKSKDEKMLVKAIMQSKHYTTRLSAIHALKNSIDKLVLKMSALVDEYGYGILFRPVRQLRVIHYPNNIRTTSPRYEMNPECGVSRFTAWVGGEVINQKITKRAAPIETALLKK